MKLKLDENIGTRGRELLEARGHDVATIWDQNLASADDPEVIAVCRREQRCLVTLDLDFANPLRYVPSEYHGIAVLRLRGRASPEVLLQGLQTLADGLAREEIDGQLWVIQQGVIRQYRPQD